MPAPVLPGAEPWSHVAPGATTGVLAIHGFTGSPSSMRPIAEAAADAGHHVELPRLPGHGTVVQEMLVTTWADWAAEVDAAFERLSARSDRVVVAGQSMGGSLALWLALGRTAAGRDAGTLAGLVLVNPATRPQPADVLEMLDELHGDGMPVIPGSGSDIADPDVVDLSYDGTPVAPLISFQRDGLARMADRYGEIGVPLRLLTSRQDHVVTPQDSEHLAASYGGEVDHTWLERSYHVATRDFDRDLVTTATIAFVERLAGRR